MNQFDEIEKKICETLDVIAKDPASQKYKNIDWTRKIKMRLADIGQQEFGCLVRASGFRDYEWLYDMCWLRIDGEDKFVTNAELVLECEWTQNAANHDFDKLLLARAKHRVMIFSSLKREGLGKPGEPGGSIKRLIRRLERFGHNVVGDRYLFAAWVNSRKAFEYHVHIV